MKRIVLIVVGALVAIAMIPIIVISINRITQEKVREEVVIFEVLTESTVTAGTYDLIMEYAGFETEGGGGFYPATNLIEPIDIILYGNGIILIGSRAYDEPTVEILDDDTIDNSANITPGFIFEFTFEVTTPAQVTGVGAALLGLVPILFVVGTVFSLVIFTKELD